MSLYLIQDKTHSKQASAIVDQSPPDWKQIFEKMAHRAKLASEPNDRTRAIDALLSGFINLSVEDQCLFALMASMIIKMKRGKK